MTIKQIEHFLKLCELKNVSTSAKEFDISQSALSNSIKELENSLNGLLFDRINKNLILNQKGKAFLEMITPIYNSLKEVELKMQSRSILNLNILASQNTGNYLLADIIAELNDKFNIKFNIKNTYDIVNELLEHKCDLGVIESDIYDKNISKIKICDDGLVVVTGDKNYADKEFYIDELAKFSWILRENGSGTRQTFLSQIPSDVRLNISLEINSTEAIKKALIGKKFFSVLPKFALSKDLYEVRIKNIKFKRDLSIVFHAKKDMDADFLRFVDELKDSIIYKLNAPSSLLP